MFDLKAFNGFYVDCHNVVKDKNSFAITRLLAADLIARPIMKVGDFFKNMADSDLQMLMSMTEPKLKLEAVGDFLLIVMMLRNAEGSEPLMNEKDAKNSIGQFVAFLVMESLARKGLVKLYHENMSFGEDAADNIVVEKI